MKIPEKPPISPIPRNEIADTPINSLIVELKIEINAILLKLWIPWKIPSIIWSLDNKIIIIPKNMLIVNDSMPIKGKSVGMEMIRHMRKRPNSVKWLILNLS